VRFRSPSNGKTYVARTEWRRGNAVYPYVGGDPLSCRMGFSSPLSLQTNSGIVSQFDHDCFLSNPFDSAVILPLDATYT
jgi:hypothetical protein